jgi:6-phosphofructokinase 1
MKIGILTSGGDAPGMNAAIRSAAKVGLARGHEMIGVRWGYEGLLDDDHAPLTLERIDGISRFGGTILGSARSKRFPTEEGQQQARERIKALGLDALVVIGGNGSLTGAHVLGSDKPCQIVGLPASIDNDVGHCGLAIGVDTAVNTIVEACDRISDTAGAHRRAFIVEVMGRMCGYLAMRAGIAAEADAILFAEHTLAEDAMVDQLSAMITKSFGATRDKRRVLIVKAEGVEVPTQRLVERLEARIQDTVEGVTVRQTILGHVVRGGSPSATDRVIAQRLGLAAMRAIDEGQHDVMMSWEPPGGVGARTADPAIRSVALTEVLEETGRMLRGESVVMNKRVELLEGVEGILAL